MATLSTSHLLFWPGTNATIPANHSRKTDWDTRFFQGEDVTAGATGGAASHNHPVPDHDHDGDPHTHDVESDSTAAGTFPHAITGSPTAMSAGTHLHPAAASAAATINYSADVAANSGSTAATPPYFDVIVIGPDDGAQQVPDDAVVLWDSGSIPSGHQFCDGAGGSPDMRDVFMRGAPAVDLPGEPGDAGGTGGSIIHTHTWSHLHAEAAHGHASTNAANASAIVVTIDGLGGFPKQILGRVHHSVTLDGVSPGVNLANALFHPGQSRPFYTRLAPIQNQTGGDSLVSGMILGWGGAAVDIPTDWLLCDGTSDTINTVDLQIYLTNNTTQIGDTNPSGSDSHFHASSGTHVHTIPQHGDGIGAPTTHVELVTNRPVFKRDATAPTDDVATTHVHNWTVGKTTATMQAADVDNTDALDGRLPWRRMLFVKYAPPIPEPTVKLLGNVAILGSAAIAAG